MDERAKETVETLNELLATLAYSLPAYLSDARPWATSAEKTLRDAVERIDVDQRHYASRLAEAIDRLGGQVALGRFSASFAAKNDLALAFLRQELIERQQQDIDSLRRCLARLEADPDLYELAEEIIGNARGHLDVLRQC